jgi:hypothetical protein
LGEVIAAALYLAVAGALAARAASLLLAILCLLLVPGAKGLR